MLVLDMGIGCSIGKVALPATAGEVSTLVVFTLTSGVLQAIHFLQSIIIRDS